MEPIIIQGPAFVKRGTHIVYFESDIVCTLKRNTWNPRSANHGNLGERLASQVWEISGTPAGEVRDATDLARYWPYAPTDVGKTLAGLASGALTTLVIIPVEGSKVTFHRSALTQMPAMSISPTGTVWGPMTWTCLGDPTKEPTNAAYWNTFAAVGGGDADTSFDASKVISPRCTIAFGLTPYDAMEPGGPIRLEPQMSVKPWGAVNWGTQSIILESLGLLAEFIPAGLTEAQYNTLLALQDASARRPGDSIGTATDLVVTGTGIIVTCKTMGPGNGGYKFAVGDFRQGAVQFHNKLTSTLGVANALWTLATS